MLRKLLLLLLALPIVLQTISISAQTVTVLHFSDYHSHALPFYTDDGERGGIARAIGFMERHKHRGALVFSGGDTVNIGAPAWSDKYRCVEWPWFNGIVDAMAFGNHDADYGREAYDACVKPLRYPILSANTAGFEGYRVFERQGVRIGVFALAGNDFKQLVKVPGFTFTDSLDAARNVVRTLREKEHVDAVLMIGHQNEDADYAMAKAVPGIDLILGSHSHLKRELTQIPGTNTWFISPSQYLTYISWVELKFADKKLAAIDGALVPVDARLTENPAIAKKVAKLQSELEADPQYRDLFTPIGTLATPYSVQELAKFTLERMRSSAQADVALSTMSSFRGSLPSGTLTMELLRAAMPYDNEIVVCSMDGAQLQRVLDFSDESFVVGAPPVDAARTYRIATTDYLAFVAYKDVFTCDRTKTGLRVRDEVRKKLSGAVGS
ncbi:MAG TPA: 5'-nucleotidase C-terminal domain-containing protein [Thermoanaerobaculia bacterium]